MTEQPARCPECGRVLRNGQRWGTADGPLDVLVCLIPETGEGCGHETPPLYKRSRTYRDWNYDYLPLRAADDEGRRPA